MTVTTLPTPTDLSITPRDRRFGRETATPRLWHGGPGRGGDGRPGAVARRRGDRTQGRRLRYLAVRDPRLAAIQALEGQGEGDALRYPQLPGRPHRRRAGADAAGRSRRSQGVVAPDDLFLGATGHVPQDRRRLAQVLHAG